MSTFNEKKFIEDVRRDFTSLALRCPFSYPLLTLKIKINENLDYVAATDATSIVINPKRWAALNSKQKLFIALHEWLHIALLHPKRIRTRQPDIYNAAADFVVNWMIKEDFPDFEFPPGRSLLDVRYAGKSVEEVYKDLEEAIRNQKDHLKNKKNSSGSGHLTKEDVVEQLRSGKSQNRDVLEMPSDANENDLIDAIIKAAARHKTISRGQQLPGGYEEYIEKLRKSSVPWTRIFARLAKQTFKRSTDRNPFKPDPKYLPFDVFIPTEISTGVPKVVLIVDTSGSMDAKEFEYALGHIEKVCSVCDKLTVITADVEVQEEIRIKGLKKQLKEGKILFKGRGGTDMTEAFERADKLRPDLIILYSDLMLPYYPNKPKAPVIFLSREIPYEKPPYGFYVHVKDIDAE